MADFDNQLDLDVFRGGFTKLPAFFVDQLIPLADGIPAIFWKYLMTVWRDVMDPHRGFECRKSMKQFPGMEKRAAMKWTAALWASGLFDVYYGKKHNPNLPGTPSVIRYRKNSTQEEWVCFIEALRETLLDDKDSNNDNKRDIEGFKIYLTFQVRDQRHAAGLSMDEAQKRIDAWIKDGMITDDNGKCRFKRMPSNRAGVMDAETQNYLYQRN